MAVLLNARECGNVTFVDANTLIVTTPPRNEAGPGLEGALLIYEPGVENSVLASGVFTYDNVTARPVIQSVSPDNGPAAGGTQITITGSDFRAGMMVQVNLRNCTNVTVVSATKITATTPAKNTVPADLEGSVRVDDPRGYFDQKLRAFTYR